MDIISIQTEQTTAITDMLLAVMAVFLIFTLRRFDSPANHKKIRIWSWAFGFLSIAASLGALAHGIAMPAKINFIIWQPLNLTLGLAISLFVAGVIYDWNHFSLPTFLIPVLISAGFIFYFITLIIPGSFIIFILYEAVAMFIALTLYLIIWKRRKLIGSGYMALGILITIIAAVIQSMETLRISIIWEFDNNGLFHIIQMIGLVFLVIGLISELKSRQ